jgi:hypothetical protein
MLGRAVAVWFGILVLAFINGALREMAIIPAAGEVVGRALSSLLLSAVVAAITWLTIDWIAPATSGKAWMVGLLWVTLTLAFEFGAGHYLFGNPWSQLLADYNVLTGRIWVLVLITTLLAPVVAGHFSGRWWPGM